MSLFIDSRSNKVIFLSFLGVALEAYDFMIFAFMAQVLSMIFFPQHDPTAALLSTFGVFAVGYLARPIGGMLFGHFGDRLGRKRTFTFSLTLMAIPSFIIGLLPTYASIGIWASLLLVAMRLIQGIAHGGELPNSGAYLVEVIDQKRRGFGFGLGSASNLIGMFFAIFVSTVITTVLSQQQLLDWGWRIAFLIGGLLGMISFILRRKLPESRAFTEMQQRQQAPLKDLFINHPKTLLNGFLMTIAAASATGVLLLFLPTYLATYLQIPLKTALGLNLIGMLVYCLAVTFIGMITDRIGRKKVAGFGMTMLLLLSYPLFYVFTHGNITQIAMACATSGLILACITGSYLVMLLESFPPRVRCTGYAMSFNMAMTIFSGLSPVIAVALISATSNLLSPSIYLIGSAVLALIGLSFMKETLHKDILKDE